MCKRDKIIYSLAVISVILYVSACSKDGPTGPDTPAPQTFERGDIISSEDIGLYSTLQLEILINTFDIPVDIEFKFAVRVVSITYQTVDNSGAKVTASGALFLPLGVSDHPLLSIQHGTETKRENVASQGVLNSPEGGMGLITASMGYVTCVPDYVGFGVSELIHPYVHAKSLAISVVDFLRAAKLFCAQSGCRINEELFLTGYSEGGYATLAAHKELEQEHYDEFNLTASAPMAGPYDLYGTMQIIFATESYPTIGYLAYIMTAYDYIYGWNRLDEIFKSPYAELMPSLFDGTKSMTTVELSLPESISELFQDSFMQNMLDGTETEVLAAIRENTLLDWTPIAPIRFYHGDADNTVPYENSTTAVDSLLANGASDIELITIPGGNHGGAALPAIIDMLHWLENYQTEKLVFVD